MTDLRIVRAVSSVTRGTDDDQWMAARGTRDGSVFTADWYDALALEGRVFIANGGTGTSPITMAGAYDADGPDLAVDIPDGTIAIPLFVQVHLESTGASMFEIIMLASPTLTAVSSGTAVTPRSLRLDTPVASLATVYAAVDAAGCTDPNTAGAIEFFRSGYPTDPDAAGNPWVTYTWSARQHGPPPIIVDGGSLVVYAGGTSGTGFITAVWVELPENSMK